MDTCCTEIGVAETVAVAVGDIGRYCKKAVVVPPVLLHRTYSVVASVPPNEYFAFDLGLVADECVRLLLVPLPLLVVVVALLPHVVGLRRRRRWLVAVPLPPLLLPPPLRLVDQCHRINHHHHHRRCRSLGPKVRTWPVTTR